MTIVLAADHRGFKLKEALKRFLAERGYAADDAGATVENPADDYVDFAAAASARVAEDPENHRGILICGTGIGMDIVANKFRGLRAALVGERATAIQSREHGNANILVLAADTLAPNAAEEIVMTWLETPFPGEERHARRLRKIAEIEERNFKV